MGVSNIVFVLLLFVITNLSIHNNIKGIDAFHQIYEKFQSHSDDETVSDLHRPQFHFHPPKNWINDPNGPVLYKGFYHLFYQYNPKGAVWGNIIWAHSVSTDLLNWERVEPAIAPSKWFDIGGTWSGSITIVPKKGPIILYTGVTKNGTQMQSYAVPKDTSDPHLKQWIKPDDNPIVKPDFTMNGSAFRDPTTAWFSSKDGHWRMLVGAKVNHRGMAYLYRSRDFKHWVKAKHPFHSKDSTGMWECPDFFPVSLTDFENGTADYAASNVKYVLKVSLDVTRFEYYTLGKYNHIEDRYVPDGHSPDGWDGLRFDYGNFYASKTFYDENKKRRILWGWANESDTVEDDIKKGWAGLQLFPRTVLLDSSKKQLKFWPVQEIENFRESSKSLLFHDRKIKMGERLELNVTTPAQADVEATFYIGRSLHKAEIFDPRFTFKPSELCKIKGSNVRGGIGPFGLITLATPDLEEYTPVFFRIFKDSKHHNKPKVLMCSDARHSSLKRDKGPLAKDRMYKPTFGGYVLEPNMTDGKIALRTLIDHSVVESFGALGKTVITSRVYPVKAVKDEAHLYVFNNGTQTVTIDLLLAYDIRTPWQMNTNG